MSSSNLSFLAHAFLQYLHSESIWFARNERISKIKLDSWKFSQTQLFTWVVSPIRGVAYGSTSIGNVLEIEMKYFTCISCCILMVVVGSYSPLLLLSGVDNADCNLFHCLYLSRVNIFCQSKVWTKFIQSYNLQLLVSYLIPIILALLSFALVSHIKILNLNYIDPFILNLSHCIYARFCSTILSKQCNISINWIWFL